MNESTWIDWHLKDDKERRLFEQERLILAATEGLASVMNATGITKAELARRLGRSRSYITQILSGSRNMTLRTLADAYFVVGQKVNLQPAPLESVVSASSVKQEQAPPKTQQNWTTVHETLRNFGLWIDREPVKYASWLIDEATRGKVVLRLSRRRSSEREYVLAESSWTCSVNEAPDDLDQDESHHANAGLAG